MNYKVGDEVLVKARIASELNKYGCDYILAELKRGSFLLQECDIAQNRDMTAEEAWEIVRKIIYDVSDDGMALNELRSVFGTSNYQEILRSYSPQQAKAKIEAWEAEKEIKVGDVVDICGDKGVVTSFGTDGNSIHVIYLDGIVNSYRKDKDIKKTGRHIDIEGLLKQIGWDE